MTTTSVEGNVQAMLDRQRKALARQKALVLDFAMRVAPAVAASYAADVPGRTYLHREAIATETFDLAHQLASEARERGLIE